MNQIVIGCGETGAPLATLLEERFPGSVWRHDPAIGFEAQPVSDTVNIPMALHICLPWHEGFVKTVEAYAKRWCAKLVVVHSTVPVGTTQQLRQLEVRAVHSPIRGMHSTMFQDLQTYVKFIGYDDLYDLDNARSAMSGCFELLGVKDSRATELGKLLELARYGMGLAFAREQAALCRSLGLAYEHVVERFVKSHNDGMIKRGTAGLRQQELRPPAGPIGGHCVLPGMRMLCEQFQPALLSKAFAQEAVRDDSAAANGVYVHDTAVVSPLAHIGHGTKIWHFSHVREGAQIGEDCSIGQGVYIAEQAKIGHRVHIGNGVSVFNGITIEDDVFVAPGVHLTNDLYPPSGIVTPTLIKRGAAIGAGATLVCGITIGARAKIAAGAVVTKDVPECEVWGGVPAVFLEHGKENAWNDAQRAYTAQSVA